MREDGREQSVRRVWRGPVVFDSVSRGDREDAGVGLRAGEDDEGDRLGSIAGVFSGDGEIGDYPLDTRWWPMRRLRACLEMLRSEGLLNVRSHVSGGVGKRRGPGER